MFPRLESNKMGQTNAGKTLLFDVRTPVEAAGLPLAEAVELPPAGPVEVPPVLPVVVDDVTAPVLAPDVEVPVCD